MKEFLGTDLSFETATQFRPNFYGKIAIVLVVLVIAVYVIHYVRQQKKLEEEARTKGKDPEAEEIPSTEETIASMTGGQKEKGADKYGSFSRLGGM